MFAVFQAQRASPTSHDRLRWGRSAEQAKGCSPGSVGAGWFYLTCVSTSFLKNQMSRCDNNNTHNCVYTHVCRYSAYACVCSDTLHPCTLTSRRRLRRITSL